MAPRDVHRLCAALPGHLAALAAFVLVVYAGAALLKVPELAVNAVGDSLAEHPGTRTLTWVKGASYRRLVLDQGRIIGAVAVGERGDFGL